MTVDIYNEPAVIFRSSQLTYNGTPVAIVGVGKGPKTVVGAVVPSGQVRFISRRST